MINIETETKQKHAGKCFLLFPKEFFETCLDNVYFINVSTTHPLIGDLIKVANVLNSKTNCKYSK